MNELAPHREQALAPAFIEAPGALGAAIRAVQRGVSIHSVSPSLLEAARNQLARVDRLAVPSTERLMLAWLTKLAPLVMNAPPTIADIKLSAEAFWDVCFDLPAGVWTDDARREWVRGDRGKFWPAPAELHAHLSPSASRIRSERNGCQAIIRAAENGAPEVEYVKPAKEERDRIIARFHSQMAELRSELPEESPKLTAGQSTKLATPSREAMIAMWTHARKQGVPGADVRLRALGVEVAP